VDVGNEPLASGGGYVTPGRRPQKAMPSKLKISAVTVFRRGMSESVTSFQKGQMTARVL